MTDTAAPVSAGALMRQLYDQADEHHPPELWNAELDIYRAGRATIAHLHIDTIHGPRNYTGEAIRHPDDFDDPGTGAMLATTRALQAAHFDLDRYATIRIAHNDRRQRDAEDRAARARYSEIAELRDAVADHLEDLRAERQAWREAHPGATTSEGITLPAPPLPPDADWDRALRHRQILDAKLERAIAAARRHLEHPDDTPRWDTWDPNESHTHGSDEAYLPDCQACNHRIERI